jgi:hypothetical protein
VSKKLAMSKKLVLISIPFFFFIYSQAQSFTLSGRVQDAEMKSGIQGATVLLKSIGDSSITSTTYTDIAGRFQFDQLQKDSFRITISSIGFQSFPAHHRGYRLVRLLARRYPGLRLLVLHCLVRPCRYCW